MVFANNYRKRIFSTSQESRRKIVATFDYWIFCWMLCQLTFKWFAENLARVSFFGLAFFLSFIFLFISYLVRFAFLVQDGNYLRFFDGVAEHR